MDVAVSYARHHVPPSVIQHAVWLYLRFCLSLRDGEDLLAERGLDLSYETVRCWVAKLGPLYAAQRFLSAHPAVYTCFNAQRHLISQRTLRTFRGHASQQWRRATMAS